MESTCVFVLQKRYEMLYRLRELDDAATHGKLNAHTIKCR